MAANFADIRAIHMDADGSVVIQSIPNAVDIADIGGDSFHFADFETFLGVASEPVPVRVLHEWLTQFCTTQDANQAPDRVVMDRGRLARPPNKTHDREAVVGVSVKQILLVALWVGLGKSVGQPVVLLNQLL